MKPALIFALSALPMMANAASFNCNKASHITENLICSDAALSARDEALAAAYKQRLALGINKYTVTASQRDFVKALRNECKDTACITTRYDARIAKLKKPFTETFMYNYKTADAYDVTITKHTSKGFHFTSKHYYVDTPETNLCTMPEGKRAPFEAHYIGSGKAQWKDSASKCTVTFIPDSKNGLNGSWMDIEASGCDNHCIYTGLGGRYESLE